MGKIIELLEAGTILLEMKGEKKESLARGTLRGGNVGWMSEDGSSVTGTCPRRAWARMEGFVLEDNLSKSPMFQAGHLNEDAVCSVLDAMGITYKREEAIPVSWKTNNGTPVTGRPDIVLCKGDVPQYGMELKLVSSLWTALEVIQLPKTDHCLQSLHYLTKLGGIPWSLLYVNRTNWSLNSDFALSKSPRQGENGSEKVEYIKRKKIILEGEDEKKIEFMEGKTIYPFYQEYPIGVNSSGEMEITVGGENYPTFIDWEGIERFYEFVSLMNTSGKSGPIPIVVNVFGELKYKGCKYCPLKGTSCSKKQKIGLDELRLLCDKQEALVRKQRGF